MKGTQMIRLGRSSKMMLLILACANSVCYQSAQTIYGAALRLPTKTSTSSMKGAQMICLERASTTIMLILLCADSICLAICLAERLTIYLAQRLAC